MRPVNSYIRILHASPDAPAIEVFIDGSDIAGNLAYRGFTEYFPVTPGVNNIRIFPAGNTASPITSADVDIPAQSIFTVAVVGRLENVGLLAIREPVIPIPPGRLYLRFAHLSPDAPNVDVTSDSTRIFTNVTYKQVTNYTAVNPGTYTFHLRPAGSNQSVLYVPNITLTANRFYTIYAVGLVQESPPLQVLIPLDGNSYIKF